MPTRTDGRSGRFYQDETWGISPLTRTKDWPSVTHVLSTLAKPALINWAASTERDACLQTAADLYEDLVKLPAPIVRASYITSFNTRLGQTKAHVKESAKATEIGMQAHRIIEWSCRKALGQKVGPEPVVNEGALLAYMAFQDWAREADVRPLAIEQTVYHPRLGYAGTLDLVAHVGGKLAVVDFKTSKSVYAESHLQNIAYQDALIEMGHWKAEIGYICRIPKVLSDIGDGPPCEVVACPPRLKLLPVLRALLRVWVWWHAAEAAGLAAWQAKRDLQRAGAPTKVGA